MPDMTFPVRDGAWPGYLAVPASVAARGPWPGVMVIHEAFGLNDDIRAKADEFATRGYLALAPDLFESRYLRVYPGAGHRFMSEATGAGAIFTRIAGMSYRPAEAADAWERIFEFFGMYLPGEAEASA